jgi:uncharacterized protein
MPATLSIKVVPGARRDRVVGKYGDAIKLQVSAPPEGGKANQAVVALIARTLGVKEQQVTIVRGHTQPRKVVRIDGIEQAHADACIAAATTGRSES